MKIRVLHNTEDGKYYSQYYSEGVRSSGWRDTYKDLHSTVQNRKKLKKSVFVLLNPKRKQG